MKERTGVLARTRQLHREARLEAEPGTAVYFV